VLVTDERLEVLTLSPDWPTEEYRAAGQRIRLSGILSLAV
jgi:hypothetical protein